MSNRRKVWKGRLSNQGHIKEGHEVPHKGKLKVSEQVSAVMDRVVKGQEWRLGQLYRQDTEL